MWIIQLWAAFIQSHNTVVQTHQAEIYTPLSVPVYSSCLYVFWSLFSALPPKNETLFADIKW